MEFSPPFSRIDPALARQWAAWQPKEFASLPARRKGLPDPLPLERFDPGAKPFDDARLVYYVNGNRRDSFSPDYNRPDDQWTAKWCDSFLGFDSNCSDPIAISPASGSASTPVSVAIQNLPSCRSTDTSAPSWDPRWPNLTYEVTSQIGGAAEAITHVDYTVTWTGKLSPLEPITVRQNCEQVTPPPAEPSAPAETNTTP